MREFKYNLTLASIIAMAIALGASINIAAAGAPKGGGDKQRIEPEFTLEEQAMLALMRDKTRAAARNPKLRSATAPIDWIAIAYHGEVFDGNYEVIDFDNDTIAAMQDSLFALLKDAVKFEQLAKKFEANPFVAYQGAAPDGFDNLALRNLALEDILSAADEQTRARYLWRINIVEREILLGAANAQYQIHPSIWDLLRRRGRYLAPGDRYIEACRAKGVPVPPEFVFGSDFWKHQGSLNYTFISSDRMTDVYAYKDESTLTPGTCVALPRTALGETRRFSARGNAGLIGVICQSNRIVNGAKHACFWDNMPQDEQGEVRRQLNGQTEPLQFGFVTDGFSLAENCTSCHRGNNVFNIHPGTALDLAAAPAARGGPYDVGGRPDWYRPIGRDWDDSNVADGGTKYSNPSPEVMPTLNMEEIRSGQRSCGECHEIGAVGDDTERRYCAILADAAHWTMPPLYARSRLPVMPVTGPLVMEGPAGWPTPLEPRFYAKSIEFLNRPENCGGVGFGVARVP